MRFKKLPTLLRVGRLGSERSLIHKRTTVPGANACRIFPASQARARDKIGLIGGAHGFVYFEGSAQNFGVRKTVFVGTESFILGRNFSA